MPHFPKPRLFLHTNESSDGGRIAGGEMTKRKKERFSATKAVKANARERVGQPKPSRIVDDKPRTGRAAKHKPKIEDLVEGRE